MACSPSSSTDKSDRDLTEATNHLISGKRQLLVSDYVAAVTSLQEACQLFSKHFGETAFECAEPYLYYGKALLELSRMESGVLGNALQGVNEDEESEEEEEDDQVENPDKVTGEEREQIVRQVEAAIDENSRDLEEKIACDRNTSVEGGASKMLEGSKTKPVSDEDKLVEKPVKVANSSGPEALEKVHTQKLETGNKVTDSSTVDTEKSKTDVCKAENDQSKQTNTAEIANRAIEKTLSDGFNEETAKTEIFPELEVNKIKNGVDKELGSCVSQSESSKETSNLPGKPLLNSEEKTDHDTEKKIDVDEEMEEETTDKDEEESATGEESESTGEKSQDEELIQEDDEAGPSTSSGAPKEDKEEDVSNLQLAWEMLELSKVIFKRQSESDETKEMKVADVLLKLGEVSIESENYQQAIEDLTECFNIQKKHLAAHDRSLAETLYQLGLATSFDNQFERAIENLTSSMKVLEERIIILKQSLVDQEKAGESVTTKSTDATSRIDATSEVKDKLPADKSTNSDNMNTEEMSNGSRSPGEFPEDPYLSVKQEIQELEGLIPDIRTKIEDTEDMMKNAVLTLKEAVEQAENCVQSPCKSEDKAKPISNISHLVKRKRKPEDDVTSTDTKDLKKPRPSEELEEIHVNGESAVNGNSKQMDTEESESLKKTKVCAVEVQPEVDKSVV